MRLITSRTGKLRFCTNLRSCAVCHHARKISFESRPELAAPAGLLRATQREFPKVYSIRTKATSSHYGKESPG